MFLQLAVAGAVALANPDTVPAQGAGPLEPQPVAIGAPAADDTIPRRRKAIYISDAYATRLKIHYIASYAILPLFAAQAIVGEQLYHAEQNGYPPSSTTRDWHDALAIGVGAMFLTNTVTGSMNWWETRHQYKGRTWRTIHGALMLLSDAGFAYTASLGERGGFYKGGGNASRSIHRQWAEISIGTALVSYMMMWKPFRHDQ